MSDVVKFDSARRSMRPKAQPVTAAPAPDQQPTQVTGDMRLQRFLEIREARLRAGVTHC